MIHPMQARRCLVVAVVGLVAAVSGACGGEDATTVEVVVPPGTQQRLDAGEEIDVMPSRIELQVGDTLRIRNDDVVDQSVGPYVVAAGQELRLTYNTPGRFEGYCPLSTGDRYEIIVER